MSEWIECGLPWNVDTFSVVEKYPKPPNLNKKLKKHFGYTEKDLMEKFFPGCKKTAAGYLDHPIYEEFMKQEDKLFGKYRGEEYKTRLHSSKNKSVKAVLAFLDATKEINAWINEQPESIEYDRLVKLEEEERDKKVAQLSFCGMGLNKPGTLIECKDGDKISYKVIGHINKVGGSCDDCRGISDSTMILRYRVLWDGQAAQNAIE
jgi:hypothetical protein